MGQAISAPPGAVPPTVRARQRNGRSCVTCPKLTVRLLLYYSKFAKDHTMFVMERFSDGSHPETHWKHETPLPGCDCIMWVTHKLLTIVAAGN